MKYTVSYGDGVISLPADAMDKCDDLLSLKFLMLLSFDKKYTDCDEKELCGQLGCTEEELSKSVAYLRGCGLLAPEKKTVPSVQARNLDGIEMSAVIEKDAEMRKMIDECQKICGKIFTPTDVSRIVGIKNLGFDCEAILLMFSYFFEKLDSAGRKLTVSYAEKSAYALFNQGIKTFDDFQTYIIETERRNSMNYRLRSLFGIGERAFTKKEKNFFTKWTEEWDTPFELIELAFNISVDSTGKAGLEYMSKILSDWHDSGIKTLEQAETANKEYRKSVEATRKSKVIVSSDFKSFNTDEFFEKALQKSYSKMVSEVVGGKS